MFMMSLMIPCCASLHGTCWVCVSKMSTNQESVGAGRMVGYSRFFSLRADWGLGVRADRQYRDEDSNMPSWTNRVSPTVEKRLRVLLDSSQKEKEKGFVRLARPSRLAMADTMQEQTELRFCHRAGRFGRGRYVLMSEADLRWGSMNSSANRAETVEIDRVVGN